MIYGVLLPQSGRSRRGGPESLPGTRSSFAQPPGQIGQPACTSRPLATVSRADDRCCVAFRDAVRATFCRVELWQDGRTGNQCGIGIVDSSELLFRRSFRRIFGRQQADSDRLAGSNVIRKLDQAIGSSVTRSFLSCRSEEPFVSWPDNSATRWFLVSRGEPPRGGDYEVATKIDRRYSQDKTLTVRCSGLSWGLTLFRQSPDQSPDQSDL